MTADDLLQHLANAYFKVLSSTDWTDPVVVSGLREGLNKFLSNAHLALFKGENKYHKTHWTSQGALEQLERRDHRDLVWEHLVPKTRYIQGPCERSARQGTLTPEFIEELLEKYWHLATITKQEDRTLHPLQMPNEWDMENIRARYEAVGIKLIPNPFFTKLCEPRRRPGT
ncbi:hypothetical protein [Halomonas sp. BC04]|uniref:hypothetical protein n=1 Tax=Halomonas sp. BC04 TaxID=1403540 RepID=UPI0003ED661B|nr:hypothetical protein [Halomonas sp. BC04]EWG99928.1 hypothetical protein Q427_22230 [Halomonas sp. BC04]